MGRRSTARGARTGWRKTVRIEPTSDVNGRRTVLKTAQNTSPDCLPFSIVAVERGDVAAKGSGRVHWKSTPFDLAFPRSSNGRTAAFGAVNRGSNPCRGAKLIKNLLLIDRRLTPCTHCDVHALCH